MTTEEALDAFGVVDVAESFEHAEPRACVFCKLGIRRLEEDFDAVERADDGFCLQVLECVQLLRAGEKTWMGALTAHPASPPATPDLTRYDQLVLSMGWGWSLRAPETARETSPTAWTGRWIGGGSSGSSRSLGGPICDGWYVLEVVAALPGDVTASDIHQVIRR